MNTSIKYWQHFIVFSMIIGIAVFILIYFFPARVGVSDDSVYYIEGARNLYKYFKYESILPFSLFEPRSERKVVENLFDVCPANKKTSNTHFPPMTSFIYSLSLYMNNNILANIKIINILSFTIFSIIFIIVLFKESRNLLITLLLFCCVFLSLPFTYIFYWAWSEPIFVIFQFFSVYTMVKFIETCKNSYFIISVITTIISYTTRYQGLSNIVAGFLAILLFLKHRKYLFGMLWLGIILLPVIINMFTGYSTGRYIYFRPGNIRKMVSILYCIILLVGIIFLLTKNYKVRIVSIFVLLQALLIFSACILTGDSDPKRYSKPLLPVISFGAATLTSTVGFSIRKFSVVLLLIFLLLVLPFNLRELPKLARNKYKTGLGYADEDNLPRPALDYIARIKNSIRGNICFFSNDLHFSLISVFINEIPICPLPYTEDGIKKFFNRFKNTNFYILWKDGKKGEPIFDIDSHRYINYNYDSNIIDKYISTTTSIQKSYLYGYHIYINTLHH